MRRLLSLAFLAVLAMPPLSHARSSSSGYGSFGRTTVRSPRNCHCDRYLNPHYSSYVPRSGRYRGGPPRY